MTQYNADCCDHNLHRTICQGDFPVPVFKRYNIRIYYEVHGEGFPVLLLAPGGMRSSIPVWENTTYNPIDQLAPNCRVIAMDQRNAGQSTAPIAATDGWRDYTDDQVALLDHLGIERFHAARMCIGGSFINGIGRGGPGKGRVGCYASTDRVYRQPPNLCQFIRRLVGSVKIKTSVPQQRRLGNLQDHDVRR